MTAISRNRIKIWVVPADTAASSLVTTSAYTTANPLGYIAGEIKSYSKSGGNTDTESDPLFGGFVDKEKAQEQYEFSCDIVPSLELGDLWESMTYGADTKTDVLTASASVPVDRAVFLEGKTSSDTYAVGYGWNNCNVTTLDMEHSAEDNQTKSLTLKTAPATKTNVSNYMFNSYSRDTTFVDIGDLPAWTALDNNP